MTARKTFNIALIAGLDYVLKLMEFIKKNCMNFLALNLSMYAEEILRKKRIQISAYPYANFYTIDFKLIIIGKLS